jgi:hypothetical protein
MSSLLISGRADRRAANKTSRNRQRRKSAPTNSGHRSGDSRRKVATRSPVVSSSQITSRVEQDRAAPRHCGPLPAGKACATEGRGSSCRCSNLASLIAQPDAGPIKSPTSFGGESLLLLVIVSAGGGGRPCCNDQRLCCATECGGNLRRKCNQINRIDSPPSRNVARQARNGSRDSPPGHFVCAHRPIH